jgi:NadR type nicotinamide-nucleotide adenylyltransferase
MILAYQPTLKGKNVGIVFGSFAPLHEGHLDMIMRAKRENDGGCLVIVCGEDGDKGEPLMPHKDRYKYVREFFSDDDLVSVYAINDTEKGIVNNPDDWSEWLKAFAEIWDIAVNDALNTNRVWYVGEKEYAKGLQKANEKVFLLDRTDNPISATLIRENPIKYWNKIALPFRKLFSKNILIAGTASEGKTNLVKDLGKYFNCPCSYEWGKEYVQRKDINDNEMDIVDFLTILQEQHSLNESLISSPANHGIFISDTDSLVTRMYAEYYAKDKEFDLTDGDFKVIADVADVLTSQANWDKIFLLGPHDNFVNDNVRFMGHSGMTERLELFNILCDALKSLNLWNKVIILEDNYYKNFTTISNYIKGVIH